MTPFSNHNAVVACLRARRRVQRQRIGRQLEVLKGTMVTLYLAGELSNVFEAFDGRDTSNEDSYSGPASGFVNF
ncbi:MAG: hypothetical protein KDA57_19310 [Planctomycetales bacterium]|nr:hypothetical protein [Planctomycetales bacterium]